MALPAIPPATLGAPDRACLPGPPGTLIDAVELQAPPGMRGWAVLYRSAGRDDEPIAVSGLVLTPTPDRAAPPVIAWAHGTTGLADACAPSRAGFVSEMNQVMASLVRLGFTVTATDYEGLGTPGLHPYLVGESEGRAVLDSVRVLRDLPGARPSPSTAIVGISQGGHAALWAGELAASYAPEIGIRGVVAASPPIDLAAVRGALIEESWTPDAWFDALLVTAAWSDRYGLPLDGLVTDEAAGLIRSLADRCPVDLPQPTTDPFLVDPRTWPAWQPLIEANSPGHGPARAPVLILAASDDEVILPSTIAQGVERLRRAGTDIDLRWVPGDHPATLTSELGAAQAVAWIAERLRD